jgi:hypothetical protein
VGFHLAVRISDNELSNTLKRGVAYRVAVTKSFYKPPHVRSSNLPFGIFENNSKGWSIERTSCLGFENLQGQIMVDLCWSTANKRESDSVWKANLLESNMATNLFIGAQDP